MSASGVSPKQVKSNRHKREEKKRAKVGNTNGQRRIANATSGGARKLPGPKVSDYNGHYMSPEPILQGLELVQASVTKCWP